MNVRYVLPALAVAALLAPAVAFAQTDPTSQTITKTYDETVIVNLTNSTLVDLTKIVLVTKQLDLKGTIQIDGDIEVNAHAMATIDNKQITHDNFVASGIDWENTAEVGANVLQLASGNIGLNVAAGDVNLQDTAVALSAIGLTAITNGGADAEVFTNQDSTNNVFDGGTDATDNIATLAGFVLEGATGSIGVNVAAGAFNNQKNGLAIASVTGISVLAEASAAVLQQASFNSSTNSVTTNLASLAGDVLSNASGNIGVNVASGISNLQSNSLTLTSAN
jgi:hypothetical protein